MPSKPAVTTLLRSMPATLLILLANAVYFAVMVSVAGAERVGETWMLIAMGAQFNPVTLDGEWYRVLTYLFVHGNVWHLATTLLMLAYAGATLEPRVGTTKFVLVFAVSGAAAALSSLYWNLFALGVGAAGGVFGLLGFALVFYIHSSREGARPMIYLLTVFGLYVVAHVLLPQLLHTDYAACFAGVLAGIAIGSFPYLKGGAEGFRKVRLEFMIISAMLVLFVVMPRHQVHYYRFFREVIVAENTSLDLLKDKLTDDDMRAFIRNYQHWDAILSRLNDQMNLPADLAPDTYKLKTYISLRKQENLFKKNVVQREAYTYLDSIERLQEKMRPYTNLEYGLWASIRPAATADSSDAHVAKVLYDADGVETSGPAHAFYRVGVRDLQGNWNGVVREYDSSGALRMKGAFKDSKREGVFLYYPTTDAPAQSGRYAGDKRFGKWETFHRNGKVDTEVMHLNGHFLRNMWDSLGNAMVVDGNGREIRRHANGVVSVEGEYRHGVKEGYWYGRYPDGDLYFEEQYAGGVLVTGRSRSPEGETFVYDNTSLNPMPEAGYPAFNAYLKKVTAKYNGDDMGHVKLAFRVTASGRIADLSVTQGATPALDKLAREIIMKGPKWLPARQHGHLPVDGPVFVQVEFY